MRKTEKEPEAHFHLHSPVSSLMGRISQKRQRKKRQKAYFTGNTDAFFSPNPRESKDEQCMATGKLPFFSRNQTIRKNHAVSHHTYSTLNTRHCEIRDPPSQLLTNPSNRNQLPHKSSTISKSRMATVTFSLSLERRLEEKHHHNKGKLAAEKVSLSLRRDWPPVDSRTR